jgi:hypothetical protein
MSDTERAFSGVVAALIEGHGADGMLADAARALRRFRESPLSRGMSDALSLPDADADLLTLGCAYHWNSAIVRRVLDDDSWQPEFKLAEQLCRNANKSDPEVAKRSPLVAFVVGGNQTPGTIGMTLDSSAFTMGQSPTRTAPKEIGGFKFGESVADATKACEGAKLAMTGNADSFRCSGPPVAVGFPAVVRLHFTEQRLSRIDLIWKLDGDDASPWLTHFDERSRALEEAFGAPSRKIRSLPSECTESFAWCLSNKKVRLESAWLWYGDRSSASVKLDRVDGRPQLRVSYEGS